MSVTEEVSEDLEVSWSEEEFSNANFGDKRLKKRLVKIAAESLKQPLATINQASEDWAGAKAAYRFFDNEKVTEQEVLFSHQEQTIERMRSYEIVLSVQDTTEADYSHHPSTIGLGPIGNHGKDALGLLLHTSLVFTEEGLPLGVLAQDIWARAEESRKTEKRHTPIEEKESYKWIKGLEQTVGRSPEGVRVVTMGDRESDVFEFLLRAEQLGAEYVIRAAQNRCLDEEARKLWEALESQEVAAEIEIEVAAQANKSKRRAILEVRFAAVTIKPPQRLKELRIEGWKPLCLWAVLVKEKNPAPSVEPIEWMLLTNVEVTNFEDAVQRVKWYQVRFSIEVYHKVLKSGCKVEDARLGTVERLKKHLALMSVVAWRLFWMTFLNRVSSESACTMFLAEHEWKALYCRIHKSKKLPEKVPTVREAVRWIAKLGGFLGRTGDKEPGVTTVWRGWKRLTDIAEDWLIFQEY
jgi:hypothetical protein